SHRMDHPVLSGMKPTEQSPGPGGSRAECGRFGTKAGDHKGGWHREENRRPERPGVTGKNVRRFSLLQLQQQDKKNAEPRAQSQQSPIDCRRTFLSRLRRTRRTSHVADEDCPDLATDRERRSESSEKAPGPVTARVKNIRQK